VLLLLEELKRVVQAFCSEAAQWSAKSRLWTHKDKQLEKGVRAYAAFQANVYRNKQEEAAVALEHAQQLEKHHRRDLLALK
jgi:hypothetical protein